ncbi:MAG: hypothetical protein ACI4U9_01650 [Clostridia bacterium]
MDDNELQPIISLFNTFLGIINYEKNTAQHKEQDEIQAKLDEILKILKKGEK